MSDALDHQLNATHFSGESGGWAGAAALTREEAANAFLNDNERMASFLKSLATVFDRREQQARVRQKEEEQMEKDCNE